MDFRTDLVDRKMSRKYRGVDTQLLINWFNSKGFIETKRLGGRNSMGRHIVRLALNNESINVGENRAEIILLNSYNGTSKLEISFGIFRKVCSNGLMIPISTFPCIQLIHVGNIYNHLETYLPQIVMQLSMVNALISKMQSIQLTQEQKNTFLVAAIKSLMPENVLFLDQTQFVPRRDVDSSSDLWTYFNVIQEYFLNGGIKYVSHHETESGQKIRNQSTRRIKSVQRQVDVNRELFEIALQFAA